MDKITIRTDLNIGAQKVGAKMNTNGLWVISEIVICGKPTDVALRELREAMLEGNKIVDVANRGREIVVKKKEKKSKVVSGRKNLDMPVDSGVSVSKSTMFKSVGKEKKTMRQKKAVGDLVG